MQKRSPWRVGLSSTRVSGRRREDPRDAARLGASRAARGVRRGLVVANDAGQDAYNKAMQEYSKTPFEYRHELGLCACCPCDSNPDPRLRRASASPALARAQLPSVPDERP